MDLVGLLLQPEGKTLEFKQDLSSPERALRSIVAFANTSGGVLLVGVEDGTRRVVGTSDPLGMEERLANLIADNIRPTLIPDLEIVPWRRTHVVAVRVHPSSTRPHYLRSLGLGEGVFVRVGSTNRRADLILVQELTRYSHNESFDEQPMPELNSEAIDFRVASELFADIRQLHHEDLLSLRLATHHQGHTVPTVGGILLFGKERERYFPDAWIQTGRFAGMDRRRILDSAEIHGYPVPAIDEAIRFVRRNTAQEAVIGEVRRIERPIYPPLALREAVINAVVHADYSQRGAPIRISIFNDRLEVENPGLLPFGLTVEDIRQGISKLRNRVIGRVFHALGLIEQWGSGIQRMTAACEAAGLDPPIFEEIGTHFRVTLPAAPRARPHLAPMDMAVLQALRTGEGLSTQGVAQKIGRSERATRSRLASLVERGLVVAVGTGKHDPRRQYFLVGGEHP